MKMKKKNFLSTNQTKNENLNKKKLFINELNHNNNNNNNNILIKNIIIIIIIYL